MNKYEILNHEPSYLPEGEWKLIWSDEFDGNKLDTSKWGFRKYYWGKKSPTFTEEGVSVSDGAFVRLSAPRRAVRRAFFAKAARSARRRTLCRAF